EIFWPALGALERGDDETRIGLTFGPFSLGHDTALATPAASRRPPELLEVARGLAGPPALRFGPRELVLDLGNQAEILLQSEQEVDAVGLAPGHQVVPCKAGVATQQNTRVRPACADARDNARHFFDCAGRRVHV